MSFLVIDIGNTRLKWAQYSHAARDAQILAHGVEFLDNIERLSEGAWSNLILPTSMLGCNVAGEAIRRRIEEQMDIWNLHARWVVSSESESGLINGYDLPSRLGSDRWVAMIGAWHHVQSFKSRPCPLVLVMVGTAVTVEAVDERGHFVGGIILPGHGIMLKALESGTAGLHVPTGEVRMFPTNTSDALTSGGTFAIAGAVERMVQHVFLRSGKMPHCVMTGGAGWKMAPSMTRPFILIENLIFEGLLQIAKDRHL
jgi:type III pantothenate kinase